MRWIASTAQVRDNVIGGFQAACDRINANPDLQISLPLDPSMHEIVIAASASWIDAVDLRDINLNPPIVTKVDPDGVAHIQYAFTGPRKKLVVCTGNARVSLKIESSIDQQIPLHKPQN